MAASNLWEDFARLSQDLYRQQTEVAKSWMEGQATFAGAGAGQGEGPAAAWGAEAAAMADLWRSWFKLGSSFGGAMPGVGEPGQIAGDTLGRFLDPLSLALVGGSQVGDTIRRLTEGPRFADIGVMERRMGQLMELWLKVQQAARNYEALVAAAWGEASRHFAREFRDAAAAGQAPAQPKEALKLWLDVANRTLLETHRSEKFLAAQAELLRHGMDFLLAERGLVEAMVEPAGLPTRTEIDEVHRSVHELKNRVRALEKAAAKPSAPASARAQAPKSGGARQKGASS